MTTTEATPDTTETTETPAPMPLTWQQRTAIIEASLIHGDDLQTLVTDAFDRSVEMNRERDALLEKVRQLTSELQVGREMNSRLRAECNTLTTQRIDAVAELERFKIQVVEVATNYAEDHGWCEVIDKALEDLGLERKPKSYRGQLVITVNFEATMGSGFRELPAESWVLDSIGDRSALRNAIEEAVEFDSDHDSGVVNGIEFAVSNIRDAD